MGRALTFQNKKKTHSNRFRAQVKYILEFGRTKYEKKKREAENA